MALINCPECGKQISDNAEKCVNCGCPISTNEGTNNKKAKKKAPIVLLIVLLIAIALSYFGLNQYKIYSYQQSLNSISYEIISSGAEVEECGNLIHDVWYNTIFEESSSETDKYTMKNGYFNDDFNDSLENLYNDNDFNNKISKIQSDQEEILNLMKEMKNPPSKHKEAYKALMKLYDEYNDFSELVIDPTGSLKTFTEDFNNKDESFVDSYDNMKMYIE